MTLPDILNKLYSSKTRDDIFDSLCYLQLFIETNSTSIFFEEIKAKNNKIYKSPKKEFIVDHISSMLNSKSFLEHFLIVARYKKDDNEFENVPSSVLVSSNFINLALNSGFYFIASVSEKLNQTNIEYIGKNFLINLKKIGKSLSYEFDMVEIISTLQTIVFDHQFAYTKRYPFSFDDKNFYPTLKKSRLIIGNYFLDFSIPIIVSNSFSKIIKLRDIYGGDFDMTKAVNILTSAFKKYTFLRNGFQIKGVDKKGQGYDGELGSLAYYFDHRESVKILFLIENVIEGLEYEENEEKVQEPFIDKVLTKIRNSNIYLEKIKTFFLENFSVFKKEISSNNSGQWSNKSFLNTIKLFSLLEAISKSNDNEWKIKTSLKYFHDWINDINDNVNYFSNLDDFDEIKNFLNGGENDKVEFKSTFGFPLEGWENEEQLKSIKRGVCEKVSETIIAMANSLGGNIFIGIVEKIDKINDKEILSLIVKKDNINFLDIMDSLKKEKEDFDSKRLMIQQLLASKTGERMDFLDSLFFFRFYKIYINDKQKYIHILNINVKRSPRIIFLKKEDNWVTMPKRLNGRVEKINPADEIRKLLIQ